MIRLARRLRLLSCLLVALLSACSMQLSYNYLDWIIGWRIDDYVDWNRRQAQDFETRLREQLAWHRRTQLLRYRGWLAEVREQVQQPAVGVAELERHTEHLETFWRDIMRRILPDAAALLSDLSDEQVDNLIEELEDELKEEREDYEDLSPERRAEKRYHDLSKAIRRWIGRLTPEQEQLIEDWLATMRPANREWFASRANWNQHFADALSVRKQPEVFADRLYALFVKPELLQDEAYRQLRDKRLQQSLGFLAQLHATLTEKQRQHLLDEIDHWMDVLENLAAQAEGAAQAGAGS